MNFLSHFYFDRESLDPNLVIGTVLPDLVKNANRAWSLHPYKFESQLRENAVQGRILDGWMRHLEVDKYFHSSGFFLEHTHELRLLIAPILEGSAVRPSFLAHVALELMLDGLLITGEHIDPHHFYDHLKRSDIGAINSFLKTSSLDDTDGFFRFLDTFIQSAYLHSYRETHQVVYALNRICQRIWNDPMTESQKQQLTLILVDYLEKLKSDYTRIFSEIDEKLK